MSSWCTNSVNTWIALASIFQGLATMWTPSASLKSRLTETKDLGIRALATSGKTVAATVADAARSYVITIGPISLVTIWTGPTFSRSLMENWDNLKRIYASVVESMSNSGRVVTIHWDMS